MIMDKAYKFTVLLILLASVALMVNVSLQEAGTQDELAHIPAGYSYVRYLDYRLNPEHPPLVKMLAGAPLLFLDLNFPTQSLAWQDAVNGQWDVGAQFLYESGNDADEIIQWSRFGPIFLTLILVAFVYVWSKELMGPKWALLPTLFTALTPNFIAHGHYVTTDIGATLGTFVAIYYFVKYLNHQSRKHLVWAGLAFGVAMLMKFSTVLLVPLFLLIIFVYWLSEIARTRKTIGTGRFKHFVFLGFKYLGKVLMVFIIGFLLLYPFYFITTINYPPAKQLSDTEFILQTFADGPQAEGEPCYAVNPKRCAAELNIWMADKPMIRPAGHYMLGVLMVLQRSAGGNTAYFLGEVSNQGNSLYFPAAYVLKEPAPLLILVGFGLLLASYRVGRTALTKRRHKFVNYFGTHIAEFSIFTFILIYALWSLSSPLNIGVRHLMPMMPFMYMLATASIKKWTQNNAFKKPVSPGLGRKIKVGFVSILTLWFFADVALAYPYYLSYYNEFVGTENGWKYITDSNYDWGQDLKRLEAYVEENNIDRIAVDYFGAGNPEYYMPSVAEGWYSAKGNPLESNIEWLAVSVNQIQGATQPKVESLYRAPEDEYQWLKNPHEPYAIAGTSIFIYKLR